MANEANLSLSLVLAASQASVHDIINTYCLPKRFSPLTALFMDSQSFLVLGGIERKITFPGPLRARRGPTCFIAHCG